MKEKWRRPNFLYIGPDKAGSTWIYQVLDHHPQIFMSPAKELFFFDCYYHKGFEWYSKHFKMANREHQIVGEVSHNYLFSTKACERIAKDLPDVRLMVCLREPVERAFSAYLYMIRQGRVSASFEAELERMQELIDHGMYAKHLAPYISTFGLNRIYIALFDDLQKNPSMFAMNLFCFLGVKPIKLPQHLLSKVLPASYPRLPLFAKWIKQAAVGIRELGYPTLVSWVKESSIVQKIFYKPYSIRNKPTISVETKQRLKEKFYPEIVHLDKLLGLNLVEKWGY
jgi:hypothetical protein